MEKVPTQHQDESPEKKVEALIRQRWETYNREWMGEERFAALVRSKVQSPALQERHVSFLESTVGSLSGKTVLDLGCGEGGFVVALRERGARVVGVDLSMEALEIARFQLLARPALGSPAILGQVEGNHLPFGDNTFDVVTSVDTLEHIPDLPGFFREVNRVLKPGGQFYANTPNRHWPYETHCRMYFLHWVPLSLRPGIVRTFFPKRLKKIEKLRYLEALNLQTPAELTDLSGRYFSGREPYARVLLNRYRNDEKKGTLAKKGKKGGIIRAFLGVARIPGLSLLFEGFLGRYSPEIILIARK